ncbi:MAG: hypothetical protein RIB64_01805, partial [Arenibacter algicola]
MKNQKIKVHRRLKVLFSSCLFLLSIGVYAQEKVVTGTISMSSGEPLPGVNVIEKGTTNGVV